MPKAIKPLIYLSQLSDDEFPKHVLDILKTPVRYHLADVVKALKFGRPAADQDFLDEVIEKMNSREVGTPFSLTGQVVFREMWVGDKWESTIAQPTDYVEVQLVEDVSNNEKLYLCKQKNGKSYLFRG